MTDRPAVEAVGLRKAYGDDHALAGLDLVVGAGTVCALLGPNGAGKTTTVRVLATLLVPDAGTARVAGFDVVRERHEVRRRLSLTGQSTAVDDALTAQENLRVVARLAGLTRRAARARTADLLDLVDLADVAGRRVATFSGGMRRRLDLALGLVTVPAVMLLDEPTTGLDPRSRQQLWQVVAALAAGGTAVLLTTQYLDEADRLADQVVVVDGGRVVAQGSPAALKERVAARRLEVVLTDAASRADAVRRLGDRVLAVDPARDAVSVAVADATEVRAVLDLVDPDRTTVRDLALRGASLDDVFLALTGHATPTKEPSRA
ncbi:ATP-binding cassette domain-containing protein [Kineosporia sp. R_H_3]|uniref:ATP-binding cassette domain-containing protein n=1 Tax=Kineosporia sp. R_H_3 TaxID=1961848 RepID=UPI0018E9E884|nr:ATP-binding cassette domain-containing protein [Kineosporia sp. R_H_3]